MKVFERKTSDVSWRRLVSFEGAGGMPLPTGHGYPTRYLKGTPALLQNYITLTTSIVLRRRFREISELR
jgi:hypothetical protein